MRILRRTLASIVVSILVAACGGGSDDQPTTRKFEAATFLAPLHDLRESGPFDSFFPAQPDFSNETIRQTYRISVGGSAVRIKFSNEYGTTPLTLDRVRVASSLGQGGSGIDLSTDKAVTFNGETSVTIAAGQTVSSDEVAFQARPLSDVAISIFMQRAERRTAKRQSITTSFIGTGDQTAARAISAPTTVTSNYFVPEISVIRDTKVNVLVAYGDSITEGGSTTRDGAKNWVDQLSTLANTQFDVAVVNGGLGGNRWVKDNTGPCGLCRIERDLLNVSGATHVIFTLGINDIGLGYYYANFYKDPAWLVTTAQIIDNLQRGIALAKSKGMKVYLGTISPFKGSLYYTTGQPSEIPFGATQPYNGEKMRQDLNAFIRANTAVDGIIDFDKLNQDPADATQLRPTWTGDRLHPNDAGNAAMARAISLDILR